MVTQQDLNKQKLGMLEKAQALHDAAALAGVDLSDEKLAEANGYITEAEALDVDIEAAKNREEQQAALATKIEVLKTGVGRKTEPDSAVLAKADIKVGDPLWKSDPKLGYASHQEFFKDVIDTTTNRSFASNERLQFLATAGSDEQSIIADPYGGFLVPDGFINNLLTVPNEGDFTAGRTTDIPMSTPVVKIPARVDKNHSTSVSGGLTVSRRIETQATAASRMEFEQVELVATSLTGAAFATDEILKFSPISFAAILQAGFRDQFDFVLVNEKLNGTGTGEMLGILNSPAKIAIAKEGSQTALTIVGNNIIKMRARAWNYAGAIWHANHDCLVQLMSCHIAGTNGDVFLFAPGNGVDVPDTLLGRPIVFTEYAETVGSEGDIALVDWSQYLVGNLSAMEAAQSVHVRFLNHENTFRFSMSNDGAPWWRTALTPDKGATLSPIVTLAVRS